MKKKVKKEKPDWIFQCNKCTHEVYVDKKEVSKMLKADCPECGEEAFENWTLIGEGDFNTLPKS